MSYLAKLRVNEALINIHEQSQELLYETMSSAIREIAENYANCDESTLDQNLVNQLNAMRPATIEEIIIWRDGWLLLLRGGFGE